MSDSKHDQPPASLPPTDCSAGLTRPQRELIAELSTEWRDVQEFCYKFHAVGNTLKALVKRGLIETRPKPGGYYLGHTWQEQARLIEPNKKIGQPRDED